MRPDQFTDTALDAADAAGKILERYFHRNVSIAFKGRIDPVTEADRHAQERICALISKRFPGHAFLAEESDAPAERKEFTWVIDPLDGTVNFIHHLPIFSVSIALMRRDEVICGVVHAPLLKETFVARKGGGAWRNGKRLAVSATGSMVRALAVTGFSYDIHRDATGSIAKLSRVLRNVQGVRRLGSAALDLAYVAKGSFELFWEEGLKPWDVAAGALLVREAGGEVTDLRNGQDYIFGKTLLATNGRVHAAALALVGGKKACRR